MMDRLTDNEIVKILECCVKQRCDSCLQYGMYDDDEDCMRFAMQNVLDLINRKDQRIAEYEAEIERLTDEACRYQTLWRKLQSENDILNLAINVLDVDEIKSEAYREFWTKLRTHGRKMMGSDYGGEFCAIGILVEDGDNLLNELTRNLHDTCTETNERDC